MRRGTPSRPSVLAAVTFVAAAAFGGSSCEHGSPATGGASSSASTSSASSGSTDGSVTSTAVGDAVRVTGVVTDGSTPIADAIVMQGGGPVLATTGADGRFDVMVSMLVEGTPTLIAAKSGYRSTGYEMAPPPDGPIELVLVEAKPPDAIDGYVFHDPGTGDALHDNNTTYCGHCHTTIVKQFQTSKHAHAARDPMVRDVYTGSASAITDATACAKRGGVFRAGATPGDPSKAMMRCYVAVGATRGVLADLNACGGPGDKACDDPSRPNKPTHFGGCADCHAPGIDGTAPNHTGAGGHDLASATGIAYDNGNHCDVCHHVADVHMGAPAGIAGALELRRPREKKSPDEPLSPVLQAMYGPFPDVANPFMGGVPTPLFETSTLCGGCHEDHQSALAGGAIDASKFPNGLDVHTTYSEWAASKYNTPGTTCELCHMPAPTTPGFNGVDVGTPSDAGITFGFQRPPEDRRSHAFVGPLGGSPRLIDGALSLSTKTAQNGAELTLDVTVSNDGAGHAAPTGEPMRALLLSVDVTGCGATFTATGGQTISDVGGARARGVFGTDLTANGASLAWTSGAAVAKIGDEIRVVRRTAAFDDYNGNGWFMGKSAMQKGIPIDVPIASAKVVGVNGSTLTLDQPLTALDGDVAFLGDPSISPTDGAPSLAIAGAPGAAFSKVLVDASGVRLVPHYRAVDIASDNRIPANGAQTSHHVFAIPSGCADATASITLRYRPLATPVADAFAWDSRDFVVTQDSLQIGLAP